MAIPDKVIELIERFARNRDAYRTTPGGGGGAGYNETQARREFIAPLFEDLGWDVGNRQGYAEAYKDVIRRQIDGTDRQIDRQGYELYGLTDDEIRIVEEATQG